MLQYILSGTTVSGSISIYKRDAFPIPSSLSPDTIISGSEWNGFALALRDMRSYFLSGTFWGFGERVESTASFPSVPDRAGDVLYINTSGNLVFENAQGTRTNLSQVSGGSPRLQPTQNPSTSDNGSVWVDGAVKYRAAVATSGAMYVSGTGGFFNGTLDLSHDLMDLYVTGSGVVYAPGAIQNLFTSSIDNGGYRRVTFVCKGPDSLRVTLSGYSGSFNSFGGFGYPNATYDFNNGDVVDIIRMDRYGRLAEPMWFAMNVKNFSSYQ